MEILTSVRRLYIHFKSLVNDFVYSFGSAALLLLVEVYNHTIPVRERRRIRVKPWSRLSYSKSNDNFSEYENILSATACKMSKNLFLGSSYTVLQKDLYSFTLNYKEYRKKGLQ